jgi:DNA repair protein RadC
MHTATDLRLGHRNRLRERLAKAGRQAFADHEILELLLTYAIPRKDTKSIAKNLISV